jgi:outer membrane lipoprotein
MARPACRPRPAIPALLVAVALTLACSSPISRSVRRELDPDIPFQQLQEQPASFEGKRVLLGGEIIQTYNKQEGTTIEVLQKRLNRWGRPRDEDDTEGRFLVFTERFLDPVVYSRGRKITIAGIVLGGHVEKIGEVDYVYPLLRAIEVHLWKDPSSPVFVYPYPVWYYWDLDIGAPW